MRLLIIDDVTREDIADICGLGLGPIESKTYSRRACLPTTEELPICKEETTQIKVGDRVQVDDPNTGYHTGTIDDIKNGSVHLASVGWFSGEFVTGLL